MLYRNYKTIKTYFNIVLISSFTDRLLLDLAFDKDGGYLGLSGK